jgi:hypothetical protein
MADWTPALLSTSSLKLFLAADLNADQTAGAKTVWTDSSGNGNDVAAGNLASTDPALVTAELNGLPVFRFNGNNYFDTEGDIGVAGNQFGVFFVVKTSLDKDDHWTSRDPVDAAFSTRIVNGWRSMNTFDELENESYVLYTDAIDDSAWHVHAEVWNTTSSVGTMDGLVNIVDVFGDMVSADLSSGLTIAWDLVAGNTNSFSLVGDVAEFIVMRGAVTEEGREVMEGYLAHKYGLDGNLPVGHPYASVAPQDTDITEAEFVVLPATRRSRIISGFF